MKVYLGDSVYVEVGCPATDGYDDFITLTTDNGHDSSIIYLNPSVCTKLIQFIKALEASKD